MRLFRHYTFVDYATQAYQLIVSVLLLLFHNGSVQNWVWRLGAHLAAMGVVHLLVEQHARLPQNKVLRFLRHFYPVFFYTWFFNETGHLNRMFLTEYLDPVFVHWDQALFGTQPSIDLMRRLPYLALSELFYASYFSYYVMISGIGLTLYLRKRGEFFHYVSVVSFVFYCCYLCYIFLPVIGPRAFYRELDGYVMPVAEQALAGNTDIPTAVTKGVFFQIMAFIYRHFESPGAAMPSSHVAIALTTLYFTYRYLPRVRVVHTVFAVLLCVSTVYCRYHYVVDVLGGILTVCIVLPVANWLYAKYRHRERQVAGRGSLEEVLEPRVEASAR